MPAPAAADRAYELTKELVLDGELPGGYLFSEGEIAERLGVSRTPVREAFLRLQAEGLLTLVPKRGAVVVPVAPDEADEIIDARDALEGAAVRRLVRRPDLVPDVVTALRGIMSTQRQHQADGDVTAFAAADDLFHHTIVEAGRSALLSRFYSTLADRQRRMSATVLGVDLDLRATVIAQHDHLASRIEDLDADGFAVALRAHLDGTHRR